MGNVGGMWPKNKGNRNSQLRNNNGWEVDDAEMKVSGVEEASDDALVALLEQGDISLSVGSDNIDAEPIYITRNIYDKIMSVMDVCPDSEWSALINENEGVVDEMLVPEQVTKGATVDFKEHPSGYDGIIHSHHNMGATFSSIDNEGINKNYDVSILVAWDNSHGIETAGSRRVSVGDDKYVIETNVETKSQDNSDFKKKVSKKISEPDPVTNSKKKCGAKYRQYWLGWG